MKLLSRSLTLAAICVLALACSAGPAAAAQEIEGVWSFNGGQVAVQTGPGGTLTGTVVAPTRFTNCTHPIGERVWSGMQRQPDGSYWGLHQWYFNTTECLANPTLGLTRLAGAGTPGRREDAPRSASANRAAAPSRRSRPTGPPPARPSAAAIRRSSRHCPELTSDAARLPRRGELPRQAQAAAEARLAGQRPVHLGQGHAAERSGQAAGEAEMVEDRGLGGARPARPRRPDLQGQGPGGNRARPQARCEADLPPLRP